VRVDAGIEEGDVVPVQFDPLVAKVIAHAATRRDALARAKAAVASSVILGVRTNAPFLRRVLGYDDVFAGRIDTGWLDRTTSSLIELAEPTEKAVVAAAAVLGTGIQPAGSPRESASPHDPWLSLMGWRNGAPRRLTVVRGDRSWDIAVIGEGRIELEGRTYEVTRGPSGAVLISDGDGQVLAHAVADGPRTWVHLDGDVHVFELGAPGADRVRPRADHSDMLSAPMPATVRDVRVAVGDAIKSGDVLVMLEAMKMELPLRAPRDGVVRAVHCATGQLVQPGIPLVELA
jgi:acetyl/propionyl-CoA carboxylase alpha subunit